MRWKQTLIEFNRNKILRLHVSDGFFFFFSLSLFPPSSSPSYRSNARWFNHFPSNYDNENWRVPYIIEFFLAFLSNVSNSSSIQVKLAHYTPSTLLLSIRRIRWKFSVGMKVEMCLSLRMTGRRAEISWTNLWMRFCHRWA